MCIYQQLFGTDSDRNRVTWETPNSEAIPSVESHQTYAPPTRPGANAGVKRTSVVEHNLYFAGLTIVGQTSGRNLKGEDKINDNYNTSYNPYNNINLKPKVKTIGSNEMHKNLNA